jgi:hypothetical protein
VLLSLVCCLLAPELSYSEELRLLAISARARVTNTTTLGDPQPEEFLAYDVAAHIGLPWQRYGESGWGFDTRLMLSAGLLRAAQKNGLVVSVIPELGFRKKDGRLVLDMGAGFALLSHYEFGTQDYGGPFQFALTAGLSFPVYKQFGLGYRFLHYSDAAVNGDDTTGADFHMLEVYYHF